MMNTESFTLLHFLKIGSYLPHSIGRKFLLAILFVFSFQIAEAQQHELDSLRLELIKAKDDTSKVLTMVAMEDNFAFYNSDSAIFYAKRALILAQNSEFLYGQYLAYIRLFFPYNIVGDYNEALQAMVAALKIAEKLPNRKQKALIQAHIFIGFIYREMGDFKAAIAHHLMVVSLLQQGGIPSSEHPSIYSNLANSYLSIQMFDSAAYWEAATNAIIEKTKGPRSPSGTGRYEEALGHYSLAEKYYRETIATYFLKKQHDNKYFLAGYYNDLARVLFKMKEYDSSILNAILAYDISVKNNYFHYELMASKTLSQDYEAKKQLDSVIKYLKRINLTNDTVFNQARLRQFQDIGMAEEQRQKEILAAQERVRNQVRFYGVLAASGVFLLIAFILFRNNRQKQKANLLLHNQKLEIENALSNLKTTQKQLIQSEKMASLGEMTAGIAHEIQNPLNFVNNFSEVNKELADELKQKLNVLSIGIEEKNDIVKIVEDLTLNEEKISHHGKRADAIVKSMLQHSRTSQDKKEAVNMNMLADEYLRLAYHGLSAKDKSFNSMLETHFDQSIGEIVVLPQDIGRALLNLFNNAFYSVNEKKKRLGGEYEPVVKLITRKVGNKAEIRIKDNGLGIPDKIVEKLFQPFFTTKPSGQGTGLGLSLTYDIITKEHGGEIKVEAKEGEYAEFIIQLPYDPISK